MTAGHPSGVAGRQSTTRRAIPPGRLGRQAVLAALALLAVLLGGCGTDAASGRGAAGTPTLTIGAIPDQDPEKLQRLHGGLAAYLSGRLGVPVVYKPVADYTAALSLFRLGDLQLVWFGGLTGVQARLQTPDARPLVQRDIDANFHSVFIVHRSTRLDPAGGVADLAKLQGLRFTFGSESSTSGRLMPQYFLEQAGLDVDSDFSGPPGFSGSHDKTISLVEAGSYQAGAVNEQVWEQRLAAGDVDRSKVTAFFRTPAYHDYHWVVRADVDATFGQGFSERIARALMDLDRADPAHAAILDLFGAESFIPTEAGNYRQIEQVGRSIGLIR